MSLLYFEKQFATLRMNIRRGGGEGGGSEKSPHKVAMLLAVMDLVEAGDIADNRIFFNRALKDKFTRYFNNLAGEADRDNPHLPFFHLRSSGFWHHQLKPCREDAYSQLNTASSPTVVTDNIAFAYLDDELFELLTNGVARALLKAALDKNLSQDDRSELLNVGNAWDWLECEAIVHDYFDMLNKEIAGEEFVKAEYYRNLLPKLNNRNRGSVESKHRNISAIMIELGQPYIRGLTPMSNYQKQLKQVVLAYLAGHQTELEELVVAATGPVLDEPYQIDWAMVLDSELPEKISSIRESNRQYLARKLNYAERERNNRALGERGESFVIEYERFRLNQADRPDLAREIEWSSSVHGDGLGYDVRSFDPSRDKELFIEVKTTNSGKYFPFFISTNEVEFSKEKANNYSLYRVYDFKQKARIYQLNGAVDQYVHLHPQSYKASFS
tara:strand:+ start:11681 stop:13006 length:1326 start_codon:yes stop_codon:yes gene_type:complete